MLDHIVLVACSCKKLPSAAPAKDLYQGTRFQLSYRFAQQQHPDAIYLLSPKHGLVEPDTVLEPYDETLAQASPERVSEWARQIIRELKSRETNGTAYTILGPAEYCSALAPALHANIPLAELTEEEQKVWLRWQL
jgi:hypothetical protein